MKNTPDFAPRSTWFNACLLWLLTTVFGVLVLLAWLVLFHPLPTGFSSAGFVVHSLDETFADAGLIGSTAAVGSLLVIPLAVPAFGHLLLIDNRAYRLLAALGTITGFFLLPVVGLSTYTGGFNELGGIISLGGWVYFPAALLAAMLVYRRGLFQPTASRMPLNINE